jgi:hypothetical protein
MRMVLCKIIISEVRKIVQRGNHLPSLFLIGLYTLYTDWLSKANWISSSIMPSKESVVIKPWKELKDNCLSIWMGKI